MVNTKIFKEIVCYMQTNYPDLVVFEEDNFIGYKFNQNDKYFIFFISIIDNNLMLSYRNDINSSNIKRINITNYNLEKIQFLLTIILKNNYLNKPGQIIQKVKTNFSKFNSEENKMYFKVLDTQKNINPEEIILKYENFFIDEIDMSNRLKNICKQNNINTLDILLLIPLDILYKTKSLGKQTFKEIIYIKYKILVENKKINYIKKVKEIDLDPIFNNLENISIKETFTEEEYEAYLDFGIEIGDLTNQILMQEKDKRNADIFKKRMNITENDINTLEYIGKEYNLTRERVRQIIEKLSKKLKNYKYEYIIIFNKIKDKEILNYLIIGLLNFYSLRFLKLILTIVNPELRITILDKVNSYKNIKHKREKDDKKVEKKLYNLINFPSNVKENCTDDFYLLKQERQVFKVNNVGVYKIDRLNIYVKYESFSERKLLNKFGNSAFVKDIKTQSMVINYSYDGKNYKYYPDIQILTTDNKLVVVEIKPLYEMLNKSVMVKYQALKEYCENKGYGYLMIDDKYRTYETLKNVKIDFKLENEFINFVKYNESITYEAFMYFKKRTNISMKQVQKIVMDNYDSFDFCTKPFRIKYLG